jgi:ABC-type Zn uptake system ZnuABC Zn-binding protein ZnuA
MLKQNVVLSTILGTTLLCGAVGFAQRPAENVNPHKHPNLAAAQRMSEQAYQKIVEAQQANEWDMDGHAQKAKELLDQVNRELKEAAEAANHNHK